jgi:exodeoxyribonuclease VII small subunit
MPKRKQDAAEDDSGPHFEEALAGLEAIVEAMENEQLPLEELVANFEKGSALLNRCESILRSARSRIELITLRSQSQENESITGNPADSTPMSGTPEDSDDDHDDIRLF